jgi:hypothetical protein
LIAPLVAPALYWLSTLAFALADPARRGSVLGQAFSGLGVIMTFGVPIAVAATLIAAGPASWLIRRSGPRTPAALTVLGAATGVVTSLIVTPLLRGELFSVLLPPWAGAALGAASAAAFWWLSRKA